MYTPRSLCTSATYGRTTGIHTSDTTTHDSQVPTHTEDEETRIRTGVI